MFEKISEFFHQITSTSLENKEDKSVSDTNGLSRQKDSYDQGSETPSWFGLFLMKLFPLAAFFGGCTEPKGGASGGTEHSVGCEDSMYASIQEAIDDEEYIWEYGGRYTICSGTYEEALVVDLVDPRDDSGSVGDVYLIAKEDGTVTISGGGTGRPLTIIEGNVVLSGLTIADGYTTGDGGGILFEDGNLELVNCSISDNVAQGNGGGLAVYNHNSVDMNGGGFFTNTSWENGGAVYLKSGTDSFSDRAQLVLREAGYDIPDYDEDISFFGNYAEKHGATVYVGEYGVVDIVDDYERGYSVTTDDDLNSDYDGIYLEKGSRLTADYGNPVENVQVTLANSGIYMIIDEDNVTGNAYIASIDTAYSLSELTFGICTTVGGEAYCE